MRLLGILGVLCIIATPVLGNAVTYTFNTTAGSVALNIAGQGSTASGLAGTFSVVINQSNGHIGASDTFTLDAGGLVNTSTMKLSLAGLATAALYPNSARFLDFKAEPGHIAGNLVPSLAPTDVYVEATVFVTGLTTTTFSTKTWAGTTLPFLAKFQTSTHESDIFIGGLSGTFGYEVGISDISLTITLDLIVNVEGTAHAVPDPALGGLTALGLGGAGAWLRRRHS
jgi:MYXO-CTERM domain-containing protein